MSVAEAFCLLDHSPLTTGEVVGVGWLIVVEFQLVQVVYDDVDPVTAL